MIKVTQSEITRKHLKFKKECLYRIRVFYNSGSEFFKSFFANSKVKVTSSDPEISIDAYQFINYKTDKTLEWIEKVINHAVENYENPELDFIPDKIRIATPIAKLVIDVLLRIFSFGRDLTDLDYFYLKDICDAMGYDPSEVNHSIEQVQYENRKLFFCSLREFLNEDQCFTCAVLLLKAIKADNRVHPAEFKYLENISHLLKNDQILIEKVEQESHKESFENFTKLPDDLSVYMFRYLTEIVMIDHQYDPDESAFIQNIAQVFGFDKMRQDEIIQPVAGRLMVRGDLFRTPEQIST